MNLAEFIEGKRDQHLDELKDFLRIPTISAKSEHKPDIEEGARWVADRLRAAGFPSVEIVPTKLHPLVYAESLEAPGKPTVLFYGHYDVQPPEPLELWTTPAFEPAVRNGNLFGRGTADDKGQVHIHLKALESLHQLSGKFPINLKVLIEGEEEVGSLSLWDFVQKNKEKLKADALVVSDTSMLAKGVPSITYGLRGLNYYRGAESAQWAALEEERVRKGGGRCGLRRRERLHHGRAVVDPAHAGVERDVGRVPGRRRQDGHPLEGLRKVFDPLGTQPGSADNRQANGSLC